MFRNKALHTFGSSIHCSCSGRQHEQREGWVETERRRGQIEGRRKLGGGGGGGDPFRSCMAGEVVVVVNPSFPSVHPWSMWAEKVSKRRVEFGFEAAQQWTLSPRPSPLNLYTTHTSFTPGLGAIHLYRNTEKSCRSLKTRQKSVKIPFYSMFSKLYCPQPWYKHTETRHANLKSKKSQGATLKPQCEKHQNTDMQFMSTINPNHHVCFCKC